MNKYYLLCLLMAYKANAMSPQTRQMVSRASSSIADFLINIGIGKRKKPLRTGQERIVDRPLNSQEIEFSEAVSAGNYAEVARLIASKVDLNIPCGFFGDTPLMLSVKKNDLLMIKQLIDAGAELDIKNVLSWCALQQACNLDYMEAVKLLIEAGANPEIIWKDKTIGISSLSALELATKNKNTTLVRYLLDIGVKIDTVIAAIKKEEIITGTLSDAQKAVRH